MTGASDDEPDAAAKPDAPVIYHSHLPTDPAPPPHPNKSIPPMKPQTQPPANPTQPQPPEDPSTKLKSPRKSRPRVTIAPSTDPGPDVQIGPP
jgi:hypothetical protein